MAGDEPTRILLVRHGQSTWNADGRWQGRADPPLSELGERQAAAVVAGLRAWSEPVRVAQIWSSPLQRARRTADAIGDGLGLEVIVDRRLEENDAGEWTGLTREEIERDWPGFLAENRRPPGFEPRDALLGRALAAIGGIVEHAGPEPVLVVTHGGVIGRLEGHLGADWERTPNLGGRELVHRDGALELGERVVLLDPESIEITTPGQI